MPSDSSSGRIAEGLREMIAGMPAGARMPPTREIVARWSASPVTVQRAVRRLVAEGLIETRPGAGNFVRRARVIPRADYGWQTTALGPARSDAGAGGSALRTVPEGAIAMDGGYPCAELLPARAVKAALARAARSAAALERPVGAGLPGLRDWFAQDLGRATPSGGSGPTGRDVTIAPGGQSALASIFRALAGPGEAVVMESPTYWGAIAAARLAGLRIVPVAREGGAVPPAVLDAALATSRANLFYAQPHLANPTGETWTAAQAEATLEVATARGAFVIEDDWGRDFAGPDTPPPVATRDADGHVVHIRSLTKSVSPAIRVAGITARGPARARIQADRTIDALYVSGVLQAAALEVLAEPGREAQLRTTRELLRARGEALAGHVERLLPGGTIAPAPPGGLNLWLRLPDGASAGAVAERCARRGLLVSPGDEWFPAEPTGAFLRLDHSAAPVSRFEEAVRILADAIGEAGPG